MAKHPKQHVRGEPGPKGSGKKQRVKVKKPVAAVAPPAPVLLLAPPKPRGSVLRDRLGAALSRTRKAVAGWGVRSWTTVRDGARRTWRELRPVLVRTGQVLVALAAAGVVLAGVLLGYGTFIADRILPNTSVAGVPVGWLTPEEALRRLEERAAVFERDGVTFALPARRVTLHPRADLDVVPDLRGAIDAAMRVGRTGDWLTQQRERSLALVTTSSRALNPGLDADVVTRHLREEIEELATQPVEPVLAWTEDGLTLTPGKSAETADFGPIIDAVEAAASSLAPQEISVPLRRVAPRVSDAEAERAKAQALGLLTTPIVLSALDGSIGGPWTLDLKERETWITFTPEDATIQVRLDPEELATFLREEVATDIDQEHSDAHVTVTEPGSWRVTVEGEARDGRALRVEDAVAMINAGLFPSVSASELSVVLPVDLQAGLVLDEHGDDLGLRDRLAHARSNFSGSPSGRDFNVRKGMKIYDGLLIPKGATFSFNDYLGPVDAAHGWKDALTIFQGGLDTRMESGGGICQVSTTVYQAAVLAGLEIKDRRAHSYFVSYYAKAPGLNGIDATVFPGSQNLVFVNDTPGSILMLAGTEGTIAYTTLLGRKDRTVELSGPFRSGSYGAGEPILTVDPSLAPGQVVIEKAAHAGFSITWKQTITYDDGRSVTNTIFSGYKAIPAQGRKGPDAAAPPADGIPPATPDVAA